MGLYSYIKGTVIDKGEDRLIIENSGIGYEIICPYSISSALPAAGDEAQVWIYQSVREDDVSLYGFADPQMKEMFLSLLDVSGIGPKVAHTICAQIEPDRFAIAVIGGDVSFLTSVKGLGKKGAERIILELKDKLKKSDIGRASGKAAGANLNKTVLPGMTKVEDEGSVITDSVEALVVLGYKEQAAYEAVSSCYEDGISLQDLIRKSLKSLAR